MQTLSTRSIFAFKCQWNWRRRLGGILSPKGNFWSPDSSGTDGYGESMHEKCCAHLHGIAVFRKWLLVISFLLNSKFSLHVERLRKLGGEQKYNLGISEWWQLLRNGGFIGFNFSGVPWMANTCNWNRACRRSRFTSCTDNAAHDVLVPPQPHCPQKCREIGYILELLHDWLSYFT